jgi:hypothetical protein
MAPRIRAELPAEPGEDGASDGAGRSGWPGQRGAAEVADQFADTAYRQQRLDAVGVRPGF